MCADGLLILYTPPAQITHAGNGTDKFGFVLATSASAAAAAFTGHAASPTDQEKWIQACINAGVLYKETDDAAVLSAKTIYEFVAKDILGKELSMQDFAGKVRRWPWGRERVGVDDARLG